MTGLFFMMGYFYDWFDFVIFCNHQTVAPRYGNDYERETQTRSVAMGLKCANCLYTIINQDMDERSTDNKVSTVACTKCGVPYCCKACKFHHAFSGHHSLACGHVLFERFETCGFCPMRSQVGVNCEACERVVDNNNKRGAVQCMPTGRNWKSGFVSSDVYRSLLQPQGARIQSMERALPNVIKDNGTCFCSGRYNCISAEQNITFSWNSPDSKEVDFTGCCVFATLEAFTTIGNFFVEKLNSMGSETAPDIIHKTYQHIEAYWKHRVQLLYLLQEFGHMGIAMIHSAEIAVLHSEYGKATKIYKQVSTLGERSGFLVLDFLASRGFARIEFRQGDVQKALDMFNNSRQMLPFIEDGYEYELLATLYNMLQCYMILLKRAGVDTASRDDMWRKTQTTHKLFVEQLTKDVQNDWFQAHDCTLMHICNLNVKAALDEYFKSGDIAKRSYIKIVEICKHCISDKSGMVPREIMEEMATAIAHIERLM
jgi:hypothetical protein